MKILIAGDFCQRYRVDEAVKQKRYGDLFDEVKPIIDRADYSIVNFEFPIVVDSTKAKPIPKCGPNLQGTIDAVGAIKYAGFKCCTLANNHILDQGEQCCLDTKNELEKAGVDAVGVGKNLEEAGNILYKQVNGETLAIINCCEHEFSIATGTTPGANPLNPIQQYYQIKEARRNANYVLVIVHGGNEYYQLPSPRMKETYRFFIDAGADAVVNHHQHCYSGYELYQGKAIFYGLGNFCFDDPNRRNNLWNESFFVTLDFKKNDTNINLYPCIQCNKETTVGLMAEMDHLKFYKNINKLNDIISNESALLRHYDEFCNFGSENWLFNLEPYKISRLTALMYRRHLLPSFISQNKIKWLINFIECESQVTRLLAALKTKINNA